MHVISLTKAWQLQRIGPSLVAATRRFHTPTGLLSGQELWLKLARNVNFELCKLEINGVDLPIDNNELKWKVDLLASSNELRLEGGIPIEPPFQRLTDMLPWFTVELQISEAV